jgi:hypothetical protein
MGNYAIKTYQCRKILPDYDYLYMPFKWREMEEAYLLLIFHRKSRIKRPEAQKTKVELERGRHFLEKNDHPFKMKK